MTIRQRNTKSEENYKYTYLYNLAITNFYKMEIQKLSRFVSRIVGNFLFPTKLRPALVPTQIPKKLTPLLISLGATGVERETGQSLKLERMGHYLISPCIFITWCIDADAT
jgi:hypothetical protein